jgi:hypothetical protein
MHHQVEATTTWQFPPPPSERKWRPQNALRQSAISVIEERDGGSPCPSSGGSHFKHIQKPLLQTTFPMLNFDLYYLQDRSIRNSAA